jgi:hypothetical protein
MTTTALAQRQTTFPIQQPDGSIAQAEPILHAWYVGMNWQDCSREGFAREMLFADRDAPRGASAIAQYIGAGEFYDQGETEPTDMRAYEYLVFSHMPQTRG